MEAVLDVKITNAQGGLQDLILKLDLLGKIEGINVSLFKLSSP